MSHALRSQNSTLAWGGAATLADPLTPAIVAAAAAAVPTHRLPQSPAPRRPFFPTLLPAAWAPFGVGGES